MVHSGCDSGIDHGSIDGQRVLSEMVGNFAPVVDHAEGKL